jgi:hypothetical protein
MAEKRTQNIRTPSTMEADKVRSWKYLKVGRSHGSQLGTSLRVEKREPTYCLIVAELDLRLNRISLQREFGFCDELYVPENHAIKCQRPTFVIGCDAC